MRLSRSLYKQYVESTEHSLKRNMKYFWSFVKRTRDDTSLLLHHLSDEVASDGGKISSLFAKRFKFIYLLPLPHSTRLNTYPSVDNLRITPCLLSSAISDLKDNTHAGPEDIPSVFIKKCYPSLEKPLLLIFNESLSSGVFSTQWMGAFTFPIHKSRPKNDISNYRPIEILNVIS